MTNLSKHLTDPRRTPQTQPIPGREDEMQRNPAGGFTFAAGDWQRLDRFLIIGTEGGTYYAGERDLTVENAAVVRRCLREDATRTIGRIIEVSERGLAPKNDAAILATALAFEEDVARRFSGPAEDLTRMRREVLGRVCRTGTHLFAFVDAVRRLRGGGRAVASAVRKWIDETPVERLGLQMAKYRQRGGWAWRDLMRLYRPTPPTVAPAKDAADVRKRRALYAWAAGKPCDVDDLPHVPFAYELAKTRAPKDMPAHVRAHRLPRECVRSDLLKRQDVLDALLDGMPTGALVRQLSRLEAAGVIEDRRAEVAERLTDEEAVRKARLHPVNLAVAAHAYESGRSGHLTWTPSPAIVDALDDAFQLALRTAEPTGKRILVAVDSSGSMHTAGASVGRSAIPLFHLAAAFTLTYVRTDKADVVAFDARPEAFHPSITRTHTYLKRRRGIQPLPVSGRMRVADVARQVQALGMGGGTDCALPFRWAMEQGTKYDAFVVLTDHETWAGQQHPAQALREYRDQVNPKARVAWLAMTAGRSDLGMPDDPLCLGVAGFDSSAPRLVGDFVAGRV